MASKYATYLGQGIVLHTNKYIREIVFTFIYTFISIAFTNGLISFNYGNNTRRFFFVVGFFVEVFWGSLN